MGKNMVILKLLTNYCLFNKKTILVLVFLLNLSNNKK